MLSAVKTYRVLFVCLGNICRSPLAEVVFRQLVVERNLGAQFLVESRGTGAWHHGEGAHEGTIRIAKQHGLSVDDHCAKQVSDEDFLNFDLIVALDEKNYRDLQLRNPKKDAEIVRLRDFDPQQGDKNVPDPYFGGQDGFQEVYEIIYRCSVSLLDSLVERLK